MELHEYEFRYPSRGKVFKIVPLGDLHYGNKNCNKKLFEKAVDKIAGQPDTYTILMGDMCEAINYRDPRFAPECIDNDLSVADLDRMFSIQCDWVVNTLMPIKHKIIGIHEGNHESKVRKYNHFDMTAYMAKALEIKNLGQCAWTRLKFRRHNSVYTIIMHSLHGGSGATTIAGIINKLRAIAEGMANSRIILMGHTHRCFAQFLDPKMYIPRTGRMKLQNESTIIANTGSFLKAYTEGVTSYIEEKSLRPIDLGTVCIKIVPDKNKIGYSRSLKKVELR
jgi:UDP-2,3-diacylglucosamine pyrophosphatase LpxH